MHMMKMLKSAATSSQGNASTPERLTTQPPTMLALRKDTEPHTRIFGYSEP